MEAKLILEDAAVTIRIGNLAMGGAAPDFTGITALPVIGLLSRMRGSGSVQKTNVKAAGDLDVQERYHSRSRSLELTQFVPESGLLYTGTDGSLEGHYIEIKTLELSSMTTPRTWVGVIEEWNWEGQVAGAQMETARIGCNPSYTTPAEGG